MGLETVRLEMPRAKMESQRHDNANKLSELVAEILSTFQAGCQSLSQSYLFVNACVACATALMPA